MSERILKIFTFLFKKCQLELQEDCADMKKKKNNKQYSIFVLQNSAFMSSFVAFIL